MAFTLHTPEEGAEADTNRDKHAKAKVSFEDDMSTDEALNYLVSLIRGIKGGKVVLRQGEESLTLEPTGTTAVKVKASTKDRKQKLSFELAWKTPADEELEIE